MTTVTPIERNRVNLTFTVTEGEPARISEVHIVGNKDFSESTLLGLFDQDSGGWLSWYTKSDRYSRAKLNADLETLRSYYLSARLPRVPHRLDAGGDLARTSRTSPSRSTSPKASVTWSPASSSTATTWAAKTSSRSLVTIRPGEPYNAEQVAETTKAFTDYFGNFGYAFASVRGRARRSIAPTTGWRFVLAAEPSRRVYVRRVNVARQQPHARRSDPARVPPVRVVLVRRRQDQAVARPDRPPRLLHGSQRRHAGRAGRARPGRPERQRGRKSRPAACSWAPASPAPKSWPCRSASSRKTCSARGNYLGVRGQHQQVQPHASSSTRSIRTSRTDGISRTFDLYHRASQPYEDQGGNYELITAGAGLRFGVPFSELDTVFFGGSAGAHRHQARARNIPAAYLALRRTQFGLHQQLALPLTVGWSRDNRDSALAPTSGALQRPAGEVGVGRRCTYVHGQLPVPAVLPAEQAVHLRVQRRVGLGQGPAAASRSRSSRTSTRAAWARCAASTRARWARAT